MSSVTFDPTQRTQGLDPATLATPSATVGRSADAGAVPEARFLFADVKLPNLPPPVSAADMKVEGFAALPSPGADVLALLTEALNDQRRANNEARLLGAQATADTMRAQADKIRDQATVNLALGLTSAVVNIATGCFTVGASGAALKSAAGVADAGMAAAQLQTANNRIGAVGQAIGGVSSAVTMTRDYLDAAHQADLKRLDAEIEMQRATGAMLDSLNDTLKATIAKAIETQAAVQESMNRTMNRILG